MITPIRLGASNAYLVQQDELILVDTGAAGSTESIIGALQAHGVNPHDVALILLTHGHSDHAGSARDLRERFGVPIAVHPADEYMVRQGHNGPLIPIGWEARLVRRFVDMPFPAFEPDKVIETNADLGGLDAMLLHTPGHSAGSISLIFPSGDAIVGDILRGGMLGGMVFSGQPHLPYYMPSRDAVPQVLESLRRVLAHPVKRLWVGHGGPIDADTARQWVTAHAST